jgi:hypothetical protein
MRRWIPAAVGGLIVIAYAFFYLLSESEAQTASSLGVVNSIGLAAVVIGLIAAGLILRRGSPAEDKPTPRNP